MHINMHFPMFGILSLLIGLFVEYRIFSFGDFPTLEGDVGVVGFAFGVYPVVEMIGDDCVVVDEAVRIFVYVRVDSCIVLVFVT